MYSVPCQLYPQHTIYLWRNSNLTIARAVKIQPGQALILIYKNHFEKIPLNLLS